MARGGIAQPQQTLAAIAALYDAALDDSRWPDALERLTALTRSQASTFWLLDGGLRSLHPTFIAINFDQRVVDEYVGGMASLDPTVRYLLAHPKTSIVHDGMLSLDEDDDTRNCMDWHERSVETRYRLVAQGEIGPNIQAGIALHRARRAGSFEKTEIAHFGIVNQHLQRALALGARLGSLTAKEQVSADLLDRSSSAVILLDASGRIVFMNRAAGELDRDGDGVRLSADGIRLAAAREDEQLQLLIRRVMRSRRSSGDVMRATRPSGRRAYGIWVASIGSPPSALSVFRPIVWVLINDPERPILPPVAHLQALFRMTDAEAKLAVRLTAGKSLQAAAAELEITYGTARTRLIQIFQKTNTHSQGELIQLLLACLPSLEIS